MEILRNMSKKKSIKINAILNIIKQGCAILFPLITFPYVSRTLGAEAYGKVSFSASIISYIALIAGLGVNNYAIREGARIRDDKTQFQEFANEVFSINIVSTLFSYIILVFALLMWEKLESYKILIMVLSINIFLTTLGTDWVNTIYEDFLYLTIRYLVCQSVAVVTTLLFVKGPDDIALYAFFSNLGTILANILNFYYIRKKLSIKICFTLKMNVKKHFRPIMLLFGNMISSMIYLYSDTTMLGIMAGDIAVGYYTVASKIYSLIKQLINAVSNVLAPRFSHDIEHNKDFGKNTESILNVLLVIVIPISVGMVCVGKEIITFIAGKEYIHAYFALATLSIALVFSTLACIFVSVIMLAQRKDKEIFCASTLSAVTNVGLNLVLIPKYSVNAAAVTTLVSEILMFLLGVYYTHKSIKLEMNKFWLLSICGGIEVFLVCSLVKRLLLNDLYTLAVCVSICSVVYGLTIFIFCFMKDR